MNETTKVSVVRGRKPKNITFIKGRPFTAKEIVVRGRNIKRPVSLPTVLAHLKALEAAGRVTVVGKRETGKKGRPSTRFQLVEVPTAKETVTAS